MSVDRLRDKLRANSFVETCALFGYQRSTRHLTRTFKKLSEEEIAEKVGKYDEFLKALNRRSLENPPLSYVIIPNGMAFDYAPIDRWYERDGGENAGDYSLFRVKLR